MDMKMLQLFAFAVVFVLFTNQTQGGPIGDFPIKTFPRVLSDVTRIFSEASEEIAKTRSSLQAMIASLTNPASDPLEQVKALSEGASGLRCQSFQLAFEGSVTVCIDLDLEGDFDDTTRVMIGDSVSPSNKGGCAEGCVEVDEKKDGAVSSLDAEELAAERGSGQSQDVEVGTEHFEFEQLVENETLANDTKTSTRREEISEIQKAEKSAAIDDEVLKKTKEPRMKIAEEQDEVSAEERLTSFFENLTNKFKILANLLLAKTNLEEHTRNKRGSIIKVPVPKITITFSF